MAELAERVRFIFSAVNRRDWETVLSFWAPDAVLDMSPAGMGTVEGTGAIRAFWEDFTGVFEGSVYELEEVDQLGDAIVLAVFWAEGPAPGSGSAVRARVAYLYQWSDDLVERVVFYTDVEEGRAAAERLAGGSP